MNFDEWREIYFAGPLMNEAMARAAWDAAIAAEREACAKVCTEIMDDFWTGDDRWEAARHCAESIRARSQQ